MGYCCKLQKTVQSKQTHNGRKSPNPVTLDTTLKKFFSMFENFKGKYFDAD
jgi:hypothetical protein